MGVVTRHLPKHFIIFRDWTKKTDDDFRDIKLIGYLCDDRRVIHGDILRVKPGKIFVHFTLDADHHYSKKYDWIKVPNERMCAPPKSTSKPETLSDNIFSYNNHRYNMYDYGSRGNQNNHWTWHYNTNQEETDLQTAITASLQDMNTNTT